jgi:hypothetical protein
LLAHAPTRCTASPGAWAAKLRCAACTRGQERRGAFGLVPARLGAAAAAAEAGPLICGLDFRRYKHSQRVLSSASIARRRLGVCCVGSFALRTMLHRLHEARRLGGLVAALLRAAEPLDAQRAVCGAVLWRAAAAQEALCEG